MAHQSIPERMTEIAQVALDRTRKGQIAWRATDDPDAFLATFTKTSLIIEHYPRMGEFKLALLTAGGANVEELMSGSPHVVVAGNDPWATTVASQRNSTHDLLKELFDAARRSALNIDELLDATIDELRHVSDDDLPF